MKLCKSTDVRKRGVAGFSLVELLVTVVVILVLASIAIPNYLNSRMAANESSAVGTLRTLNTALSLYMTAYPEVGYPATLSDLSDGGASPCTASATQACLIDTAVASGVKSGYTFTYTPDLSLIPSGSYTISADPVSRGTSGRRSFFTDQPAVIRSNTNGPATVTDPPIPN